MKKISCISIAFWLISFALFAQTGSGPGHSPSINEFSASLSFLSSDWMEGREAGARGGLMAADYIASMMQTYGLTPCGDRHHRFYFQNFEVISYKTVKSSFEFVRRSAFGTSGLLLSPGIDYEITSGPDGTEAEAQVVFAGYGITAPDKAYDDYKGQDVSGRMVAVLDGFPGHSDTTSAAWKKFGKDSVEHYASVHRKVLNAEKHGAVALILVSAKGNIIPYKKDLKNRDLLNSAMNSAKNQDPDYDDPDYALPGDTANPGVPCFSLGRDAARMLFAGTGIVLSDVAKKIAGDLLPATKALESKLIRFSVSVETKPFGVRNVMGMIRGKDSSRYIIIGAHYDHLGIRDKDIYNGADDNASGVSGMLALAKVWSEKSEQPPVNIIFAAWTAEEKGLLGSSYFVQNSKILPSQTILYINMDMISRSAPEDTAKRQLSIGTMPQNDYLKKMATEINLRLARPFKLDLWDVTGHTGSDYDSFASGKIPVMTFFSGFHDDYHTIRDIAPKTDPVKMQDILRLVNSCLSETIEKSQGK